MIGNSFGENGGEKRGVECHKDGEGDEESKHARKKVFQMRDGKAKSRVMNSSIYQGLRD